MAAALPDRLFVTGTDTAVGKSLVAATLTLGLGGSYWKPVQTGCCELSDSEWIGRILQLPEHRILPEAYCFEQPLSPHAAAAATSSSIDLGRIAIPDAAAGPLIVEGAGGVLVPLNASHTMIDLMRLLGLPVLVVARSTLGTINHTLLTVAELRRAGLEPIGVAMNGPPNPGNRQAIEQYGKLPVLAEIAPLKVVDRASLLRVFQEQFEKVR